MEESQVEAIVQSRLQDKLRPVIIGLILLYLISTPVLLYFYNPNRSSGLINQTQASPITDPKEFANIASQIGLGCPVEDKFCSTKIDTKSNGYFAQGYLAAPKSFVTSKLKAIASGSTSLSHDLTENKKRYFESVQMDNQCYAIIYTFPDDAAFSGILERVIATLGSKLFKISDSDLNVLVQIQKNPIDPRYGCSLSPQHLV